LTIGTPSTAGVKWGAMHALFATPVEGIEARTNLIGGAGAQQTRETPADQIHLRAFAISIILPPARAINIERLRFAHKILSFE
jgi:hypothetical protein